jgi:predicted GH43/DUF377 family glycosyl hydrolase
MKKLNVLFSFLFIIIIISCSSDPVSNEPNNSGKILLKIDKQKAPASVVFVKAYLTRENHPPITGTLNLQSDSTADVLLENIDAGEWHLKVDAEDDSGLVLYTGETEVQIFAGFTSQVYLTLSPTGSGTGSIYISVTWGVPFNYSWIDYYNNPLIVPVGNIYDNVGGVAQPVVIYDSGLYKMWYHGLGRVEGEPWKTYVMYKESVDGINWTSFQNPVIFPGVNSWDSKSVSPGAVLKENGIYKMYYCGYSDEYDNWHVGLATSVDGINWTKHSQPIIYGTYGWEHQIVISSVVKINNTYYLYYTGRNMPEYKIGIAISTDGINFTKYSGNPILTNNKPWELNGVLDGSVIMDNGTLKMVYMNSNASGFGFATSTDGLNWIKEANNPFFTINNTANNWGDDKIAYPSFVKNENEYKIYYCGIGDNSIVYKIGLLKKQLN